MNAAAIAAIVRRHGTRLPGGDWELLVPQAEVLSIPQGSRVLMHLDPSRQALVVRLSPRPTVIDITSTTTDAEGVPIQDIPLPELSPRTV
jgi:hypothetical protein